MELKQDRTEITVDLNGTIEIISFTNGKKAMVTGFNFGECVRINSKNGLPVELTFIKNSATDNPIESEPEVLLSASSDVTEKTNQVGDESTKPLETSSTNMEEAGLEECIEIDRQILLILGFLIKPDQLLLAKPRPILLLSAGSVDEVVDPVEEILVNQDEAESVILLYGSSIDVKEIKLEETMIGNEQIISNPDSQLNNSAIEILTFIMNKDGTSRDIVKGLNLKATAILKSVEMLKDSGLICAGSDKLLRANSERVLSLYPWLGSKMIQDIILQKLESGEHLNFAPSVQRILCLLSSHPEGLHSSKLHKILNLVSAGLVYPKKILTELGIIEVTNLGGRKDGYFVLPKFEINQVKSNDSIFKRESIKPTTTEIKKTSPEPIISALEEELEEVKVPVNTSEGFNIKNLTSVANRIESSPESFKGLNLQHLSSQFKAKKEDGRLIDFLNEINNIIQIEILDVSSNKVIGSWKPKEFKNRKLENLRVRKRTNDLKEEDKETKDTTEAEQAIDSALDDISNESENKDVIIGEEQKRERDNIIRNLNLGDNQRCVLFILNDSPFLEMDKEDLINCAKEKGFRRSGTIKCFGTLATLVLIRIEGKKKIILTI